MEDSQSRISYPLLVHLEGALLRTDPREEARFVEILRKPISSFQSSEPERESTFSPAYSPRFLSFLRREHTSGRTMYLVTASDRLLAEQVNRELRIFEDVFSLGDVGPSEIIGRIGSQFGYAAGDGCNEELWRRAENRVAVNLPVSGAAAGEKAAPDLTFDLRERKIPTLLRALRVHQWAKNLLLALPLFAAHEFTNYEKWQHLVLAFLSFCFTASAVYLFNDCLDLQADRRHHFKRRRPLAAGTLSVREALVLLPVLCGMGLLLAGALGSLFLLLLVTYLFLTTAYSLFVKKIVLADSLLLAVLYTLRVLAGGVATEVVVSEWLLCFAIFFFLSLAFAKRYAEIHRLKDQKNVRIRGRGYVVEDLDQVAQFGTTSGYLSVLVLALYINSEAVRQFYTHPELLWLICPLLLYWISRIWMLARRGRLHEDAVVFAIRDRTSYVIGVLTALIVLSAV